MNNSGYKGKDGRTTGLDGDLNQRAAVCEQALSVSKRKVQLLLELGNLMGLDLELGDMLTRVAGEVEEVMEAEHFTVFIHDSRRNDLWSIAGGGKDNREARVPVEESIAGYCLKAGETKNIPDITEDRNFAECSENSKEYPVRSIISMPIYGRSGKPIGVMQLLNKKEGNFTGEDEVFLNTFSNHVSVFIEMAQLKKEKIEALEQSKQEAERLAMAKGKALDHLAHELRTPLAILQGTMKILQKKMSEKHRAGEFSDVFEVFRKSIERLLVIQKTTDKILRAYDELDKTFFLGEAENAWRRLEKKEQIPENIRMCWEVLKGWITEKPVHEENLLETVSLFSLTDERIAVAQKKCTDRRVGITLSGNKSIKVNTHSKTVCHIIDAYIKNAVENTPDGGKIEVTVGTDENVAFVAVHDYGIGITEENKENIFSGLFHTQETNLYRSRKPYMFGAGGKGLELFLAKIYAKRYGYDLNMISSRCTYIPTDEDTCPGDISLCRFCSVAEDCFVSGESTFTLLFPHEEAYNIET